MDSGNNQAAVFLHTQIHAGPSRGDPTASFGRAPAALQKNPTGSVLVFRRDKKPLSSKEIETLCHWCQYELCPLFGRYHGEWGENQVLIKVEVLRKITKSAFKTYAEKRSGLDLVVIGECGVDEVLTLIR